MNHDEILRELSAERARQARKWNDPRKPHAWGLGDCSSPNVPMVVKAAVLAEEAGEVVQAVLNAGPDDAVADDAVRSEVIQTMTVAYAILEGM